MFMESEYKPYLENKIFKNKKTQLLFIEDIWKNPKYSVNLICKFLNTKKTKSTAKMLQTLYLPRLKIKETFEKQFYYLKNKMNKSDFEYILNLEKSYKNKKNLYGF